MSDPSHSRIASACLAHGGWRDAGDAGQALVRSPADPASWVRYGVEQARAGRFVHAETALRRALELDPGDVAAAGYLGVVLHHDGRPDDASELLDHEGMVSLVPLRACASAAGEAALRRRLLALLEEGREPASRALLALAVDPSLHLEGCLSQLLDGLMADEEAASSGAAAAWRLRARLARGHPGEPAAPCLGEGAMLCGVYLLDGPSSPAAAATLRLHRRLPWLPVHGPVAEPHRVALMPGDVAVFPSHFWHDVAPVLPSGAAAWVAFDVLRPA